MTAPRDRSAADLPVAPARRKPAGPARRPPLLAQGIAPAAVGAALLVLAEPGTGALLAGVLVVQLVLTLGLLALLDAPSADGIFVTTAATALVGDVLVLRAGGDVGSLAGVVAAGLVAALLYQLFRRQRERVTESLADAFLVLVVVCSLCCLLALRDRPGGEQALDVALAAGLACLLAGRLGDMVLARPVLALGATRGWPGLVLGLGAGVAAAAVLAGDSSALAGSRAALLGLAVAATVATADLAVDLGAAELRNNRRDARRVSALTPVSLLLPFAALAPVALVAGRLVLP